MSNSRVIAKLDNDLRITLSDIEYDLNNDMWDALYFARESQIVALIDAGRISEDFSSRYQDYQEEMRCMTNEF